MKLIKRIAPLLIPALLGCSSSIPPEYGMVDWSITNNSGGKLTLVVYDKVCRRTYFRVQLSRSGETAMETCATSDDKADIRYRQAGYDKGDYPWVDMRMNRDQSLLVR